MKDLVYFGDRIMDLDRYVSIETYVKQIKEKGSVFIALQPGDGTMYKFYLIMAGEEAFHEGEGVSVWLTPVNLDSKLGGTYLRLWPGEATEPNAESHLWDLRRVYKSDWTCELLAHYMALFAEEYHRGDQ